MTLSEAVTALCEATEANGASGETVASYRRHLKHLVEFLGDMKSEEVTESDLRRYAADLRQRDRQRGTHVRVGIRGPGRLSPHSVNSYLRSAKRLFAWLAEERVTAGNVGRSVRISRADLSDFKAAREEDLAQVVAGCDAGTVEGARDRALIGFMWSTGCRAGGVRGLRIGDVDYERLRATVVEKGAKRRTVFFEEWVAQALRAWLALRPEVMEEWIFVGLGSRGYGGQLSQSALGRILRRRAEAVGLVGRCNPHSLRHAFAVRYLRRGGSVGTLSLMMGHSDISTTVHYYGRLAEDEIDEQYRRYGGAELK